MKKLFFTLLFFCCGGCSTTNIIIVRTPPVVESEKVYPRYIPSSRNYSAKQDSVNRIISEASRQAMIKTKLMLNLK